MDDPYISVMNLKKKHKLIFLIFSFILIIVCTISLFLPYYSKIDWITGHTIYIYIFKQDPVSYEFPGGFLALAEIDLYLISITLTIFIENMKKLKAIYIWDVILWFISGFSCYVSLANAFVGSDTVGFKMMPEIGYYLRYISWSLLGIPLLYFGVILFLILRNEKKND